MCLSQSLLLGASHEIVMLKNEVTLKQALLDKQPMPGSIRRCSYDAEDTESQQDLRWGQRCLRDNWAFISLKHWAEVHQLQAAGPNASRMPKGGTGKEPHYSVRTQRTAEGAVCKSATSSYYSEDSKISPTFRLSSQTGMEIHWYSRTSPDNMFKL